MTTIPLSRIPAPFTVFLITLEVFATGRFSTWEPTATTRTDDVGVRRFSGNLHTSTRDRHLAVAAFHQVSAFRRLAAVHDTLRQPPDVSVGFD